MVGEEAGESKLKKAAEKKVECIDEDKLLELIRTKPGKRSKYEIEAEREFQEEQKKQKTPKKTPKAKLESPKKSPKIKQESPKTSQYFKAESKPDAKQEVPKVEKSQSTASVGSSQVAQMTLDSQKTPPAMWVEKYKPKEFKKIVGQNGAASCANKLLTWLKNWHTHQACPKDQRPKARY